MERGAERRDSGGDGVWSVVQKAVTVVVMEYGAWCRGSRDSGGDGVWSVVQKEPTHLSRDVRHYLWGDSGP